MNDDERCLATSCKIFLICNFNLLQFITFGNGIKKENKGKMSSLSTSSSSSRGK